MEDVKEERERSAAPATDKDCCVRVSECAYSQA